MMPSNKVCSGLLPDPVLRPEAPTRFNLRQNRRLK
jgi:hypothetical protein